MTSASASYDRKVHRSPDRDSCIREFGRDSVTDNADGSWLCSVKGDKARMMKAEQMMAGVRKEDAERGDYVRSSFDHHRFTAPDGRKLDIADHLASDAVEKNPKLRGSGRNGLVPSEHFGLSGSCGRYDRGPDGLYFVWNGGWEPTKLFTSGKTLPARQRDPAGNVWVRSGADWELEP